MKRVAVVSFIILSGCTVGGQFHASVLAPLNRPESGAVHVTEETIVVADILRTQGETEAIQYLTAKGHLEPAAQRIVTAVKTACKCGNLKEK